MARLDPYKLSAWEHQLYVTGDWLADCAPPGDGVGSPHALVGLRGQGPGDLAYVSGSFLVSWLRTSVQP